MSTSFYDKVLNKLETFYEPSSQSNKNINQMAQNIEQQQLRDSHQFRRSNTSIREDKRSNSTKPISMANRINKIALSNDNSFQQNNNSPLQNSKFIPDKQNQVEQLEEMLFEERTKNSSYLNEIFHLNQRIEELEYHFKEVNRTKNSNQIQNRDLTYSYESPNNNYNSKSTPSLNANDNTQTNSYSSPNKQSDERKDYETTIKENEELRKFKEEVYTISKEYDNINENIIVSLQEMDKLFSKINEAKYHMTYTKKAQELTKAQSSFENVINTIIEMMKGKQDEYNFLVKEKEKEVLNLKEELKQYDNKVKDLKENAERRNAHCCCCNHQCQGCNQCSHHYCVRESSPEFDYMKKRTKKNDYNLS